MKKILQYITLPITVAICYLSLSSNSGGINGKSVAGCGGAGCHSATTTATVITLTGLPANGYTAGTTYTLTLTATNANYTAAASAAGFNLTVSAGAIGIVTANTALNGATELRHSAPQTLISSSAAWQFSWTAPASGSAPVAFSAACNIVNGNGQTSGDAQNLFSVISNAATTTAPIVTTAAATSIGTTTATLNGSVNANGTNTGVGISFEYGTTTGYGNTVIGTPATATGTTAVNSTSALTGLTPNTLYNYRIKATTATGVVTNGPNMTFTTLNNLSVQSITKLGVKVYPNPATNKLILDGLQLASPKFSIVGINGQICNTTVNTQGSNYVLSLDNLAAGTYVLYISSKAESFTYNFSKQ